MSKNEKILSYYFKLNKHARDLEFIDLDLSTDLNLYVDPILLYRSPLKRFHYAHTFIVEFFTRAINYVKRDNKHKAKEMCQFPDAENLLGVASTKPGHGPSKKLGERIYNELVCNKHIQEKGLIFLNEFQLIIPDISYDLISDAAVQISKDIFIEYTQKKCKEYGIPLQELPISHNYDWKSNEWIDRYEHLPLNPFKDKAFLLTPWTVTRRYPDCDYQDFYKEIYRYVLLHREKTKQWKALGKKPKVTFEEIQKKYSSKKENISRHVKENPKSLNEYLNIILPNDSTVWLEKLSLQQDIHINKLISKDVLDTCEEKITNVNFKGALQNLRSSIEHQSGLKKPKKRIINAIEQLAKYCKNNLVLLLGNFTAGHTALKEIRSELEKKYEVIRIDEIKQEDSDSLIQSVNTIAALAKFTIMEDSYSGGQSFELASLTHTGNIIAVLREKGKISTFMTKGISRKFTNIKEFEYIRKNKKIKISTIEKAIRWAENTFKDNQEFWRAEYPWRK